MLHSKPRQAGALVCLWICNVEVCPIGARRPRRGDTGMARRLRCFHVHPHTGMVRFRSLACVPYFGLCERVCVSSCCLGHVRERCVLHYCVLECRSWCCCLWLLMCSWLLQIKWQRWIRWGILQSINSTIGRMLSVYPGAVLFISREKRV